MDILKKYANNIKANQNQYGGTNMKATGIVRRIDDLGRVVIPKEIRRTMRIREGDPLCTSLLHTLKPALLLGFQGINKTLLIVH